MANNQYYTRVQSCDSGTGITVRVRSYSSFCYGVQCCRDEKVNRNTKKLCAGENVKVY